MARKNKKQKIRQKPEDPNEEWTRRSAIIKSLSASVYLLKKGEKLRMKQDEKR
jgi:hypothetical protein